MRLEIRVIETRGVESQVCVQRKVPRLLALANWRAAAGAGPGTLDEGRKGSVESRWRPDVHSSLDQEQYPAIRRRDERLPLTYSLLLNLYFFHSSEWWRRQSPLVSGCGREISAGLLRLLYDSSLGCHLQGGGRVVSVQAFRASQGQVVDMTQGQVVSVEEVLFR